MIARPFAGAAGAFERTRGRRDFALAPPTPSYLDALQAAGVPVHGVGKVAALFAGVGIDVEHPGATNDEALASIDALIGGLERGLVFANLIETDQVYGHRKDVAGFHGALRRFDACVAGWLERLGDDDLLVLTADHGCDPAAPHTDHTREHAPLLARFAGDGGRRHDGPLADVGASVLDWLAGASAPASRATRSSTMPELPEVETIRRQLAPALVGAARSRRSTILDPRWCAPLAPAELSRRASSGRRRRARSSAAASTWSGRSRARSTC